MNTILFVVGMVIAVVLVVQIVTAKSDWITAHVLCPREIQRLPTNEERRHVASRAFVSFLRRPRTWGLLLCYTSIATVIIYGVKGPVVTLVRILPGSDTTKQAIGATSLLAVQLFPFALLLWHWRYWMHKYLRDYLNERGMPTCRRCGYDLRGRVSAICPECGTTFVSGTESREL